MQTNVFTTQIAKTPGAAAGSPLLQGKGGIFGPLAPGMSFMDLIMAQLLTPNGDAAGAAQPGQTDSNQAVLTAGGTPAEIQQMIEQAMAGAQSATDASQSSIQKNPLSLVLMSPQGQTQLMAILQNLLNGLPQGGKPTVESLQQGLLKKLDPDNLNAGNTDPNANPALIVTGLSPQQINDLLKKLQDDNSGAAGNLFVGLVQIVPADIKKEALFQPGGSILPAQAGQSNAATGNPQTGADAGDAAADATQQTALNALTAKNKTNGNSETGFERVLKIIQSAQESRAGDSTDQNSAKTSDATASNSAILSNNQTTPGNLTSQATWSQIFPDGMSWAGAHASSGTMSLTISGTAPLTSLVNHAPQAVYPHPATQQVVSAMVTNLNGDDKAFTLKLDPPELGKIDIRMEFSKDDKTLKTVITAQKPETYLMLQRDSQTLQNALRDNGFDASNGGLSFQLSQDGSLFNQNNNGQGGGNNYSGNGGNASGSAGNEITINTAMNWSIDPQTGAMHYDVLA